MQTLNSSTQTVKPTLLRKSFLIAGIAFAITTVIGLVVSFWLKSVFDSSGLLSGKRFDTGFISKRNDLGSETAKLFKFLIAGGIISIFSSIITLVWMFRILKAGKLFIYVAFASSILSQGIGFGMLFTIFNAMELLSIFGIGGGLFLIMAMAGYMAKDLSSMRPFLIAGTIAVMALSLVSVIMYFAGVYSDTFYMMLVIGMGILTLAWTMFDVWTIKRTSEYYEMNGSSDDMMQFRLQSFFGFKLFTDLVAIIWTIARIYMRMKR